MKTLKTLFAAVIVTSVAMVGTAQADELMDIIHPESADLFDHSTGITSSERSDIVSLGDTRGEKVWSYEYEQYVNPDDFSGTDFADINKYMEANPTAAGKKSSDVFQYNETAGDYQLN